jgi:hypothetical protein
MENVEIHLKLKQNIKNKINGFEIKINFFDEMIVTVHFHAFN